MFKDVKRVTIDRIKCKRLPLKKIAIATSAMTILGMCYSLASWYNGNSLQSRLNDTLININQRINYNPNYDVQLRFIHYAKGIFVTETDLQIDLFDKNSARLISSQILPMTIYHGPFPWRNVSSGHFMPKLASIYYQMDQSISTRLWQSANNQPFITANVDINYDQSLTIKINNSAIDYSQPTQSVIWQASAGQTQIIIDQLKNINVSGSLDHINLIDGNKALSLTDISWTGQQLENNPNMLLAGINVAQLMFNQDLIKVKTNQLKFEVSTQLKDQHIALNSSLSVADTFWGQQNIGQGQIALSYESSLDQWLAYLSGDHIDIASVDEQNPSTDNVISFSLDKFLWQNQQGDITANLATKLSGGDLDYDQLTQNNLMFFKTKINVPLSAFAYLLAQYQSPAQAQVSEIELENQYNDIKRMSAILLQNAQFIHSDLTANAELGGLSVDLYYSENEDKAMINDKAMNKDKFWQMISQLY